MNGVTNKAGHSIAELSLNTTTVPPKENAIFNQIQLARGDPRTFIHNALNGEFGFLIELFNMRDGQLRDLELLLIDSLNRHKDRNEDQLQNSPQTECAQSSALVNLASIAKLISVSPHYIYSPRLLPIQQYKSTFRVPNPPSHGHPVEQKWYIFLPSNIYQLFERSPDWRSPLIYERAPKAPSYRPLKRPSATPGDIQIDKCIPSCLKYQRAPVSLSDYILISDLAYILTPVAQAYLNDQPDKGNVNPLGYLCFFEQIFGASAPPRQPDEHSSIRGVQQEDILPMACLAWCLSQTSINDSGHFSGPLDDIKPPTLFNPQNFAAPTKHFHLSPSLSQGDALANFLSDLNRAGQSFDEQFSQDSIRSQFDRLSGSQQFLSDNSFIELVRALCPLALPTKNDTHAHLIKPFCYLEERRPAGTTQQDRDLYLQGHVTWTREEYGQIALYTARVHTLHRNDSDIKHPTMRVYRTLLNPDPKSDLGSWQFLINREFCNYRHIPNIGRYMERDKSGNDWISGTYVDTCSDSHLTLNGEKISPRQALLTATHFSFVHRSWLK
jgi:hypothetical protein